MIGYVYLTVNDINTTIYVGKRQKARFEKSYKGSGTHLKLAFKKYGKEHFHTSVLEWCETEQGLCEAEIKWIKHFRDAGANLYNIADGGKCGCIVDWASMPREKREKINAKNRESHIGAKNGFYGKHHTEEAKQHLRQTNSKNKRPRALAEYKERQRNALPRVNQLDIKTCAVVATWNNWCEAGKAMRPNQRTAYAHISECCNGRRKTAYGYKWAIEEGWKV